LNYDPVVLLIGVYSKTLLKELPENKNLNVREELQSIAEETKKAAEQTY